MPICSLVDDDSPVLCGKSNRPAPLPPADPTNPAPRPPPAASRGIYYLVVYQTMNGPSEFTVTGTLKTWDIMDRLDEIRVPTLLIGGRYDECTPAHLEDMRKRIPGSQLQIIEDASHLCFAEQPAEFSAIVNSFLDRTDHGSSL
jgi:proline-specific peptidase